MYTVLYYLCTTAATRVHAPRFNRSVLDLYYGCDGGYIDSVLYYIHTTGTAEAADTSDAASRLYYTTHILGHTRRSIYPVLRHIDATGTAESKDIAPVLQRTILLRRKRRIRRLLQLYWPKLPEHYGCYDYYG